MNNKTTIIFTRNEDEKINNNLFLKAKKEKYFYVLLNFGKKIKSKNNRIINCKKKYVNSILEKIIFSRKSEYFMFVNISADEIFLKDTVEKSFWYFEKYKEKAGVIDFVTSCNCFHQLISEEVRFYPSLFYNLYKTFILNKFYFTVKKNVLVESLKNKIPTKIFKESIEYLLSFICFYKKLLICKDTTFRILLDNNMENKLKKNSSLFNLNEHFFQKYTNFYFILFFEILVFIIWKIPSVDFTYSTKSIGILKPIIKKKLK